MMSPASRKFALTAHVATSVGWLGAVVAFLALAIAGLSSSNPPMVRAAYLAMNVTGWSVIVPLCLASFVTGLVQALGTPWGLLRHYWVVVKLIITVIATVLLLVHMRPISLMADVAEAVPSSLAGVHSMRMQVVVDAGAALVALLLATGLSVYKPSGRTGLFTKL